MNKKRAVIIHGWGGRPEEGWLPWLKDKLAEGGFEITVPKMPDSEHPKMVLWLNQLTNVVVSPDEDLYLIGHSLGCITILRYLETLNEKQEVGGVVLVAGFSDSNITLDKNEDIAELASFFETDVDFEKIKSHCEKFVAIHSDNDPYVSLKYADIFKKKLSAEVIIQHDMGHFSDSDGVKELPVVLDSVLDMEKGLFN